MVAFYALFFSIVFEIVAFCSAFFLYMVFSQLFNADGICREWLREAQQLTCKWSSSKSDLGYWLRGVHS